MLAVLEHILRCLLTCAAARTPIRRRMFLTLKLGSPTARLAGRSHLRLSVTRSESNPIARVTAYVDGVSTIRRDELPPPDAEALGGQKCGAHRLPGLPRTTARKSRAAGRSKSFRCGQERRFEKCRSLDSNRKAISSKTA